jgi:8-hydroxy-5-deazaflavin:NADPH oxidoreductase
MHIAIVGAGNVGKALGIGWRAAGHQVSYALRQLTGKSADEARKAGLAVTAMGEAAAGAEVVVIAVPWPAVPDALRSLGDLSGKIVIDATNPLSPGLELALGYSDSAAETVARLARGARVVKAFNTTGAENMAKARAFKTKAIMPVASDDPAAKAAVIKLAEELGFQGADAGPLRAARLLEPMALFWIKQAIEQKIGTSFAFAFTRRP